MKNACHRARAAVTALVLCLVAVGFGVPRIAAAATTEEVPVFVWHLVDTKIPRDPVGNQLTVTPEQLASELAYLDAHGYRGITAEELVDRMRRHAPLDHVAVLTFDDGYADARTDALPILERYRAHATFYVIAHTIGTPRHLSWNDIRTLLRAGMEIGAHGTDHWDLSQMTAQQQRYQVTHVLDTVQRYVGVRPKTYAYPSGGYNATTLAVMKAAGIEAAFTMKYGGVRSLASPYELPRVRINRTTAQTTFESALAAMR